MARETRVLNRSILSSWLLVATLAWPGTVRAKEPVEETLKTAYTQLSLFNWDVAYKAYGRALDSAPEGSPAWQEAALGRATCAEHATPADADRVDEARGLFEKLADPKLNSRFAPRALMSLGRIAELSDFNDDVIDLVTARKQYQAVLDRFADQPIAHEAALRLAGAFVQSYKDDEVKQGVAVLENWLQKHPDNGLASAMWQYLGDTYFFPLKDYKKSLDAYIRGDNIGFLDDADLGSMWWRMAKLAELTNNRAVAVQYYTKIITDSPVSGKGYESQLALKRLGAPVPELRIGVPAKPKSKPTTTPTAPPVADETPTPGGKHG